MWDVLSHIALPGHTCEKAGCVPISVRIDPAFEQKSRLINYIESATLIPALRTCFNFANVWTLPLVVHIEPGLSLVSSTRKDISVLTMT